MGLSSREAPVGNQDMGEGKWGFDFPALFLLLQGHRSWGSSDGLLLATIAFPSLRGIIPSLPQILCLNVILPAKMQTGTSSSFKLGF